MVMKVTVKKKEICIYAALILIIFPFKLSIKGPKILKMCNAKLAALSFKHKLLLNLLSRVFKQDRGWLA